MDFVPLADVQDSHEDIVARLWAVAGVDDDQDEDKGVSWAVRASRRLQGDTAVWDTQGVPEGYDHDGP